MIFLMFAQLVSKVIGNDAGEMLQLYFSPACEICGEVLESKTFKKLLKTYKVTLYPVELPELNSYQQAKVSILLMHFCPDEKQFLKTENLFYHHLHDWLNNYNDPELWQNLSNEWNIPIPDNLKDEDKIIYLIAHKSGINHNAIIEAISDIRGIKAMKTDINAHQNPDLKKINTLPHLESPSIGVILAEEVIQKIHQLAE